MDIIYCCSCCRQWFTCKQCCKEHERYCSTTQASTSTGFDLSVSCKHSGEEEEKK